jgi:hypothetical protein
MLDVISQQKFTRGCTEAAAGYAAAATAAYTDFASQALDFWCTALSGLGEPAPVPDDNVDEPAAPKAVTRAPEPPFGMAMADWSPLHWLDPRRYEAMMQVDFRTPPVLAMLAFANAVPLRGTAKSWPFAQAMIESGVPRAIAWPAAEANAAALEAADVASNGLRQVMASYHTENGFAATVRSATPSLAAIMMTVGLSLNPTAVTSAWA